MIPEHPELMVAYGAALSLEELFTDEGEAREIPKLMKQLLLEEQSEQGEISDSAKPFFASEKEKLAFEKRHSHHPPEWKLPEKGETVRSLPWY